MKTEWAEENLQTIRTLMERSAVYRRALAPIMLFAGVIGIFAAMAGWTLKICSPTLFVLYWFTVAVVVLSGAFIMARRQAWRDSEPFWSPPTRRIAQAMLPPLLAGFALGVLTIVTAHLPTEADPPTGQWPPSLMDMVVLPLLWVILYGCAVHAAGFFISRGMRIFGLIIVVLGCGTFVFSTKLSDEGLIDFAYAVMGFFFGLSHLAYGTYLALMEKGKTTV